MPTELGLIKGFQSSFEQNAFLALVGFGFIVGSLLIRWLLLELRGSRKETNEILKSFNHYLLENTKATTELTLEIQHLC